MPHPLRIKLGRLRGRVWRLVVLHGASRVLTAALAVLLVVGLADYLLRFQDLGVRLIVTATVLGVVGWTGCRYLAVPLGLRFRDVDLARKVERRFPRLGDRLASAVEFLDQPEEDPLAGSASLRRAVIAQATAESDELDFCEAVVPGPSWQAAIAAAAVALVAAIVVVVDPFSSRIALARLANPFGGTAWPQTTHLALRRPIDRVAKGQAFEVEVVDRFGARLPSVVRIHYRFEDAEGKAAEETQPMHFLDNAMVARRENVTRPFSFRVEGGDDNSMPWLPVEVVDPPAVASLAVRLKPPDYTGWSEERADGHIRALEGTEAEMAATATKPLVSAALALEDGRRVPGEVAADGCSFTIPSADAAPLVIEDSGGYWFELVDTEGLTSAREPRWEIRVVPDAPPTVIIEQPAAAVFVTPEAVVPLRMSVKDDLAVHRISLEYERSDRPHELPVVVPLDEGPPHVGPGAGPSSGQSGTGRVVTHQWQLAPLGLAPATELTFRGVAADYRPQTGASEPRRVVVITPEELADRVAARQAFVLSELARVLEMQRSSRSQVAALEIRLEELGRLDQLDVDHLHGAELTQRQVTRSLTSPSEGVPMHVAGLLADLANNKIDAPDVHRRMEGILAEIRRLERDELPVVARELTAAVKGATVALQDSGEEPAAPETPLAEPLAAAGRGQDRLIASLEQMLGELANWDSFRRFHRDVGQLLRDQEDLARRSGDLARRTLTKDLKDLLPQETAELKIAGRDQLELARRLDRIQQTMQASVGQLEQTDPLAAETLSDAAHRAAELAIGRAMRTAGEDLQRNRMGQATAAQKKAVDDLREVLDILSNRREHELARLVRKLREAEADLAQLAKEQEDLKSELDEAAARSDAESRRQELERLQKRQNELQEETERIQRRLERLMAEQAAQTTGQAADAMKGAGQCAGQNEAAEAARQADKARQKLEEARQQLADQRRQAELELAYEQLARLEDALKAVRGRQQKAIDETLRLDGLGQLQGRLSDAQLDTLGQLAREQRLLGDETAAMADDLAAAEVIGLALADAEDRMSRAAAMLDRRQTGQPTTTLQQAALVRLDQLLEAIRPDEPEDPEEDSGDSGGGEGGPSQGSPGEAIQALAELKLMKLLQEEINARTRRLDDEYHTTETLPDEARQEYAELSRRQGRLADLLLNLVPPAQDPESDVDSLPDGEDESLIPFDAEESP